MYKFVIRSIVDKIVAKKWLKATFLSNELKKCHFCQCSDIRKHGIRNNTQRYKCNACNKTFIFKKKLNSINIWNDYLIGKQAYKQLAKKYHSIQMYIEKTTNRLENLFG